MSIVESFTPPAQWVPGQKVNKDVYATNTGNIAAFVKEDISGILNYTYESTVSAFDATNGVKLNETTLTDIDGATTMEGSAWLAWTSTDETLGAKVSARETETDIVGTRWTPIKPGVYIFRRTISNVIDTLNNKGEDNGNAPVTCTYAGYYFNGTDYYKIVIGGDVNPDNNGNFDVSSKALGGDAKIDETGTVVSGAPKAQYVVETEVTNKPVSLEYDATNHRLVATYSAEMVATTSTDTGGNTYDASATAARAEIDYFNQLGISNDATKAYLQLLNDYEYAKALAEATNTLYAAADDVASIKNAAATADADNTTAQTNAKNGATNMLSDTDYTALVDGSAIKYDTIIPSAVSNVINANDGSATPTYTYPQAHTNYEQLKAMYEEMYGNGTATGYAGAITAALNNMTADDVSATDYASNLATLKANVAALKSKLRRLYAPQQRWY